MTNSVARKPRVFHLITRLLNGGAEEKLWTEISGLDKRYEFSLGYGASAAQSQVARFNAIGVPMKQFVSIRHYNPISLLIACVSVGRYLKTHPVDIVHTHSTEAGIVGRIAARWARTPTVHTIHGVPFTQQRNRVLSAMIKRLERWATTWTHCIIANADTLTKKYLDEKIGRPEQYTTIPSGIDLETFKLAQPLALNSPKDAFVVLMAARLAAGKGFDELLEAAEKLQSSHPRLLVLIAGTGPLEAKLKKTIAQKNLSHGVKLLGHHNQMAQLMKSVDLLVLPSYREGTPRVISEAMAAGLPVVATNVDGIPDQIQHGVNGLLIEPRSVRQLSDAIAQLADNPELCSQMGQAGERLSQNFSHEIMLESTDLLYQRLLASSQTTKAVNFQ